MEKQKQIYAIVRYPKSCKNADIFSLNVYAAQTSNLEKITEYYNKLKTTYYNTDYNLAIAKRETAKMMYNTWRRYMRGRVIHNEEGA